MHGELKSPQVVNIAEGGKRLRGKPLDETSISKNKRHGRDVIRYARIKLRRGLRTVSTVVNRLLVRVVVVV